MIRKLLAFTALSLSLFAAAFGQRIESRAGRVVFTEPVAGGYLGVQMKEITKKNFADFDLKEVRGVAVVEVAEDSPAEKAGILKGDVILRFAGEEVSSVYKLTRLLSEIAPDHAAKISVLRSGGNEEIELTATLGERAPRRTQIVNPTLYPYPGIYGIPRFPLPPGGTQTMPPIDDDVFIYRNGTPSRQIGVNATPLTKQLGEYLGVASGEGLLIDFVRENSPAAKAGLKAGDVITAADGKSVKTKTDLINAFNAKKEGDVTLTIVRDKNSQTIKVTPDAANRK